MRILVTGGAGFIGSHLVRRCLSEGNEVRVYDNLSTGRLENLAGVLSSIEFIEADVRDAPSLERAMAGCEVVFHEAAVVSVPYSVEHPQETHDVNLQGTLNVLQSARAKGVRRIVFACSAAVYGNDVALPKVETMAPCPASPYGVEKIAGEYYLLAAPSLYGVEAVSLRYFNVFGPRQDPRSPYSGVISVFVNHALRGTTPTIFGDGEQTRDFVYVDDVVEANWLAATSSRASGHTFNVGRGEQTSLNELLRILTTLAPRTPKPRHEAPRAGDIRDSRADISKARALLGFEPKVTVESGLSALFDFVRASNGN